MADNNLDVQGKILTQLMIQTMNQEREDEKIAHEKLLEQIHNLALVRRQEEKSRAILYQINIITCERKRENFKAALMTDINQNKYSSLKEKLSSEEINVLLSTDKEELLKYAVDQFSQKAVLILLDFFSHDISMEKKKEVFAAAVLTKIPHPDQYMNKSLLYSGRFLHNFLEKSGIPQTSLWDIFPSYIVENAHSRISNMHNEQTIKVPRRRVQSS